MPELPEVETTRRSLEAPLVGRRVTHVVVRDRRLRWPIEPDFERHLTGASIRAVGRRAKYLLVVTDRGTAMIHLGMSGSLRVIPPSAEWKTHDHVGITLSNGKQLRFHDPRRFGLVLRISGEPEIHPLLSGLGPEPLEEGFTQKHLAAACAKRSAAIKLVIMDAKVVVGVGNIYASEALFRAGIPPKTPANRVSKPKLARLVQSIREVLSDAIQEGGTTLRDFLNSDGEPGYFRQKLFVYERKGEPCRVCETPIRHAVLGQRSTYWCPKCQK